MEAGRSRPDRAAWPGDGPSPGPAASRAERAWARLRAEREAARVRRDAERRFWIGSFR